MAEVEPHRQDLRGGRVLVVDDIGANRELLRSLLVPEGVVVDEAKDGIEALERVATHPPDVVLLDVQMPRMDGFEACRRLKSNPATAAIPVLMVTAHSEREQRLEGIRAGANDLVTKPVDGADLTLRVRNALHTRRLYTRLDEQLAELRRLEGLRDDLTYMLVHDLRSPLTALSVTLQVAAGELDDSTPAKADLVEATQATSRLADMISDILDVGRLEAGGLPLHLETVDLRELCTDAIRAIWSGRQSVRVQPDWPDEAFGARVDRTIVSRVVANLVDNGVKFGPADEAVRVGLERRGDRVRVTVADRGPGVPAEARAEIFAKYRQGRGGGNGRRSTGLGLAFCKMAVEAHGGTIGVDAPAGGGSLFWFELPVGPG